MEYPGTGELKWISISSPLPTADTRYDTFKKAQWGTERRSWFCATWLRHLKGLIKNAAVRIVGLLKSMERRAVAVGRKQKPTVNIQEKQYKRNAFWQTIYRRSLWNSWKLHEKLCISIKHSMALAMQTMIANITYNNDRYRKKKASGVTGKKRQLNKSLIDFYEHFIKCQKIVTYMQSL